MDKFRICKPDNGSDSSGGQSPDWSSESSSDDAPLSKLKVKFTKQRKPLLPKNTENSSDSDTPLSTYIQRKQTSNTSKQKHQKPDSIENKENSEETAVT